VRRKRLRRAMIRRGINLWPPFFFTGIRVVRASEDWREVDVALRLRWFNRNAVGVHFGGSLFAMTDPFLMLMFMDNLGHDYVVWDQAATIEFVAPGRGTVHARFRLSQAEIESVREAAAGGAPVRPEFTVEVVADDGSVVARVRKTVYVRKRRDRA
jgi:acyl-coenzyme A thioesterase PaaI-like protein